MGQLINDHVLLALRKMEAESVNCIITSPPYWSLRKYDIPDIVWDGMIGKVEKCRHDWGPILPDHHPGQVEQSKWKNADGAGHGQTSGSGQFCQWCGAWLGQLGLEPTIDLYLSHLMQIMDECKRVLRDDGTMWVNLGDSYNGSGNKHTNGKEVSESPAHSVSNLPTKSLCLIPERFSIEMVNRGWILRNKIIWWKPNCMPSSVKDRFTVDWEPVYFFVKSKKYWFERQYEPHTRLWDANNGGSMSTGRMTSARGAMGDMSTHPKGYPLPNPQGRNRRCVWEDDSFDERFKFIISHLSENHPEIIDEILPFFESDSSSVWNIPTQPFPESHFATFPERLIGPMILAGCPEEVCKVCDQPRRKIKVVTSHYTKREKAHVPNNVPDKVDSSGWEPPTIEEMGETDCGCNAGFEPGIVLDPFIGSGTVAKVAESLGREWVGIDLGEGYCEMSCRRVLGIKGK